MRHLIYCLRMAARHPAIAAQGVREFRSDVTTHHDWPEIESYDAGRELAHIVTLRHYDQSV